MSRQFGICGEIVIRGAGQTSLAPDLTYLSDKSSAITTHETFGAIAVTAGVKSTVISLSGKFVIPFMEAINLTAEAMTWKLTVDGEVKWDSVGQSGTSESLIGGFNNSGSNVQAISESIECQTSFLLEVTTTADTSVGLFILARPAE